MYAPGAIRLVLSADGGWRVYQRKNKLNPNMAPSAGEIASNWFTEVRFGEGQHIIKVMSLSATTYEDDLSRQPLLTWRRELSNEEDKEGSISHPPCCCDVTS